MNKLSLIAIVFVLFATGILLSIISYNVGWSYGSWVTQDTMRQRIPAQTDKEPQYPRVSFNSNVTLFNIKDFSIPRYGLILPANSTYRVGYVIWKGTIQGPQSCEISLTILSVNQKNKPSIYADLPLTITYLETPCDSEGPTTKNMFYNSRTVNSTYPTLIEEVKARNPIDRVDKKGAQISLYCNGEFKQSITLTKKPDQFDIAVNLSIVEQIIKECPLP